MDRGWIEDQYRMDRGYGDDMGALGEGKGFLIIGAVSRKGGSIEDIRQ
jgi:hypothetical protein